MSVVRLPRRRAALVALGLAGLLGATTLAWADGPGAPKAAAVAAAAEPHALAVLGFAAVIVAAVAGVGAAVAILGALFPRMAAAADRQARAGAPTTPLLVGSLVGLGAVLLQAAAAALGPTASGIVFLGVGVPALVLLLVGTTATVPLLGERLLGARGPERAPLTRAVVGALALGAALLPGGVFQLHPLAFLVGLAVLGWPVGVGLATFLAWRRARRAPPTGS